MYPVRRDVYPVRRDVYQSCMTRIQFGMTFRTMRNQVRGGVLHDAYPVWNDVPHEALIQSNMTYAVSWVRGVIFRHT